MCIETHADLVGIQRAGRIVARVLKEVGHAVRPGVRTIELDALADRIYRAEGARSAPRLFFGFPGAILVSVNDEAVHGIPGDRILRPGDVVKIDVTVEADGYIADAARTLCIPPSTSRNRRLSAAAREALADGISAALPDRLVSRIGYAVEKTVRRFGFAVIRDLNGHGTGRAIWEEPTILNYHNPTRTDRLVDGLVIAIEPIVTSGSGRIFEAEDGWTLKTTDGAPAVHWEDTVIVRDGGAAVLTR
ncbi:MAG: type I methionyl aminopeptidase [Gemmatimonadota bacterium]